MHRTAIVYYGGKGMISGRYPKPHHSQIVEPFAGGASYSLRYYMHDVLLIDKNSDLVSAWKYIQNPCQSDLNFIDRLNIRAGDKISDLFIDIDPGLMFVLRAAANVGTAGQSKKMDTITSMAAPRFVYNTSGKIRFWTDKIKHWHIMCGSYHDCPDFSTATYFIDPPYQNAAGKLYKFGANQINYTELLEWSKTRPGQTIITENSGADWLKSEPQINLMRSCGTGSKHISKNRPSEIYVTHNIYTNSI